MSKNSDSTNYNMRKKPHANSNKTAERFWIGL